MAFRIIMPEAEIITPIRDLKLSREAEIDYLKSKGVEQEWHKAAYSINKGLWGTSVGGKETLTSDQFLPESAWPTQISKTEPETITLHFTHGELTGLGDEPVANPVEAIQKLTELAGPFGIGRDIHIGDYHHRHQGPRWVRGSGPADYYQGAPHARKTRAHQMAAALERAVGQLVRHHASRRAVYGPGDAQHRNLSGRYANPRKRARCMCCWLPTVFQVLGIESEYDLMSAKFRLVRRDEQCLDRRRRAGAFSKVASNQVMIYEKVSGRNY